MAAQIFRGDSEGPAEMMHEILRGEQGVSLERVDIWDASNRLVVLSWETRASGMGRVVG